MVPVAVVTGPVGVGKSAVLREADELLIDAGIPHASVELEELARFWGPVPAPGRTWSDVGYRNLASVCVPRLRTVRLGIVGTTRSSGRSKRRSLPSIAGL